MESLKTYLFVILSVSSMGMQITEIMHKPFFYLNAFMVTWLVSTLRGTCV